VRPLAQGSHTPFSLMLSKEKTVVSYRHWWYTTIYYGAAGFTVIGFSLLAYRESGLREWSGYLIGAFGGAVFAVSLMIVWLAWRGRLPLVSQRQLSRIVTTGVPFYFFNAITGYAAIVVQSQQPTTDPRQRDRIRTQRERYADTLVFMERWRVTEQWRMARRDVVARDLPARIDVILTSSQYVLDSPCISALTALATESTLPDKPASSAST